MTATKSSRLGLPVAVLLLSGSLVLNIYLWGRSGSAVAAPAVSAARSAEKPKPATGVPGIPSLDFARDADLPALRDALYAAGASETRARQIIYGVLRRRYREAVT